MSKSTKKKKKNLSTKVRMNSKDKRYTCTHEDE